MTINHKKVNISYFCITFTTWQLCTCLLKVEMRDISSFVAQLYNPIFIYKMLERIVNTKYITEGPTILSLNIWKKVTTVTTVADA